MSKKWLKNAVFAAIFEKFLIYLKYIFNVSQIYLYAYMLIYANMKFRKNKIFGYFPQCCYI